MFHTLRDRAHEVEIRQILAPNFTVNLNEENDLQIPLKILKDFTYQVQNSQ